jgi:RNA polymerase sigma-70 factor, ECF subfamily
MSPEEQRIADLYRRYGPAIYSRCKRVLNDPQEAEDAVQEVFVRVSRHLKKVPADDLGALKWLYRISTNYCLNKIRDRVKRAAALEDFPEQAQPDVEQILLDRDVVRRLLFWVPDKLRGPAVLYYLDDMDQSGVAEVLGITTRTVVNRLNEFRARSLETLSGRGRIRPRKEFSSG